MLSGVERHLQSTEQHINVALAIGAIIVGAGGALVTIYQFRAEKERRAEWESWKADFQASAQAWQHGLERQIALSEEARAAQLDLWRQGALSRMLDECATRVDTQLFRSFRDLSSELSAKVLQEFRAYSQEALMQSPAVRGALYSRFNRLAREVSNVVAPACDQERLYLSIWTAAQDWLILGQLYSQDNDEVIRGLHTAKEHPIAESRERLRVLAKRHEEDASIGPLAAMALRELDTTMEAE